MKKFYLFVACQFIAIIVLHAQWALTGNSISSGNFMGTTNAQNLVFKANNTNAGLIDVSFSNTAFGLNTLTTTNANSRENAAFGRYALQFNSTGFDNVAVGYLSLPQNTSGSTNTAIGAQAMYDNISGTSNTAVGALALRNNTSGNVNDAFGINALQQNTTGSYNEAYGTYSLFSNTTGSRNIAMGFQALYNNTTASNLIGIGYQSLFNNTSGTGNTAVGYSAMTGNTVGGNNTAVGYLALTAASGAGVVENAAFGESSLTATTSGTGNTALGTSTLIQNTSGGFNVAVGDAALVTNTTGSDNIGIGIDADVAVGNLTNAAVIGTGNVVSANNTMRLGQVGIVSLLCDVDITVTSDGRFKRNIQENVPGLEFINQLRPVTYTLDITSMHKFLRPNPPKSASSPILTAAISQAEQVTHTGFIAQEVETVAKKLNYNFSGVDAPKNNSDIYGLRYSEFVMPLVKSVQQLSKVNDSLTRVIDSLKSAVGSLQEQVNAIVQKIGSGNGPISLGTTPVLKQNAPNPFSNSTVINYYLPPASGNSTLTITDVNGRTLKVFQLSNAGQGQAVINGGELASGTYFYSLSVAGSLVETKKMVLTK